MNKPVYILLSILELNKILMHDFWCDYEKPKYGENATMCYMDTDSFIVYIDIDTSNYELDRPLPKGKNKKVIGLMKDELGGKIMIKFVGLRVKTYNYLIDDGCEDKKAKDKKMYHKKKT